MTFQEAVNQVCENPLDKFTWSEWVSAFNEAGIQILNSPELNGDEIDSEKAKQVIEQCEVNFREIPSLDVDAWRAEFQRISDTPPVQQTIKTVDGTPIRLEVELQPGKPPFIYSRIYVPKSVGGTLGWFAQSITDISQFGWKAVMMPKSRDEIIRKKGIASKVIGVKEIFIIKKSSTGSSLLAEVTQF